MNQAAKKVRDKINAVKANEQSIWSSLRRNSSEYMRVLELKHEDLEVLSRGQGRGSMYPDLKELGEQCSVKVVVDDEKFALNVKMVCGAPYGGDWMECMMAICVSNPAINNSVGYGTSMINVIANDWHIKLIDRLRQDSD